MEAYDLGRLLRWYPQGWRDRYGEEFVAFMQDSFGSEKPPLAARMSVAAGGIREHARRSGFTGDSVPPKARIRAGVVVVLVSWAAMVIAGSSFAKLSEHFDAALGHRASAHQLPDLSYAFVRAAGGVAGLLVVAGAALAAPAFLRYLRSGGWMSVRTHALRAVGCTALTAGTTAPLLVWAHSLSAHQRNGGSTAYTVLFLVWAALVVATVVLWTVLAAASALEISFSRVLLAVEAAMALAVALAMLGITSVTVLWWAVMAERAPAFLSGEPASAFSARLLATVILMALAGSAATSGAVRIARSVPEWRGI